MAQIKFAQNYPTLNNGTIGMTADSVWFHRFNIYESVSLLTINLPLVNTSLLNATHTLNLGIYTLTGSTLSIVNSCSTSFTTNADSIRFFANFTTFSATSNMTPGSYFFGMLQQSSGTNGLASVLNNLVLNMNSNWPGGCIGGRMTVSTAALPSTVATSDLSTTTFSNYVTQEIIISG